MSAPIEPKLLRSIRTGKGLIKVINNLQLQRKTNKAANHKRLALTKSQRAIILAKTDSRCHICGIELAIDHFHADHVKTHITGGKHHENNYLPSCSTCNSLRWHYSSEEIQIILKLGRWLKTQIIKDTEQSLALANGFVKHEISLRKKRKK